MGKQVDKNYYAREKYLLLPRWCTYFHQFNQILEAKPGSVLEIGVGDRIVGDYLKKHSDVKYASMDIAEDLEPDIVASIDEIPLVDNSFDVVCAFEVLEHLPFEKFVQSLSELKRVARKRVIISLPHWGRHFSIQIRMPLFKKFRRQFKFSLFPIVHINDGQHYWEIGKRHYPLKKIKKAIESAGFNIIKDYIVFESPYHHFFILDPKK